MSKHIWSGAGYVCIKCGGIKDGTAKKTCPGQSPRVTTKRIQCVIKTALKFYNIRLTDELAKQVIQADVGRDFVSELHDSGHLDTLPRDYFGMALIDVLMPGPPAIQDEFIAYHKQEKWHWPLNGSSDEYVKTFDKAWRKATKKIRRDD